MKTKATFQLKTWRSADEMHADALRWLSELHFIQDELTFLEHLLEKHFATLTSKRLYHKSTRLVKQITETKNIALDTSMRIKMHNNQLELLLDGINQPREEAQVKENHRWYMQCLNAFFDDFRDLKRTIFTLVSDIMIENKKVQRISTKNP